MNNAFPSITSYNGTRQNALRLDMPRPAGGHLVIWYSYQTPVAFAVNGERTVRQNDWAQTTGKQTTGKHLNLIDHGDKASRISGADFEAALAAAMGEV